MRLFVLGALCALPWTAQAGPADDALRRFVDGVQTLSATFEQTQKDERGEVLQASTGRVWLSRPRGAEGTGRFRWSYETPYEQLLVCDGTSIFLYDPDLAQVTVRPAGETLAGTPAELLSRPGLLDRQFTLADGGLDGASRIVKLTPKAKDGDFRSIELWLRDGTPVRMRFSDALGGTTDVEFGDVKVNAVADEALFRFKPPKGAEVIQADPPSKRK